MFVNRISTFLSIAMARVVLSEGLLEAGYNGNSGPIYWGKFNSQCDGWYQSPVNLEPDAIDFKKSIGGVLENPYGTLPDISYPDSPGTLTHDGHTIKFTPNPDQINGKFKRDENNTYTLRQFHVHTPSEHRVNGEFFPMEFHFVHYGPAGSSQLAVIGAFVRYGDFTSPFVKDFLAAATGMAHGDKKSVTMTYANVVNAIQATTDIYIYTGSLTTTPCTEGVAWHVASDPNLVVTPSDAAILMQLIGHSSRITMPLSNVYDTQWITKRKSDYKPVIDKQVSAHHYHLSYDYNGFTGPDFWKKFNPACNGKIQSPIDIDPDTIDFGTTLNGVLDNPKGQYPAISYPPSPGLIKNLGDTIKFTPTISTGTFWRGQNDIFNLAQFHFHAPSEHRVKGMHYPLEVHFVHTKVVGTSTALAVIGAFIDFAETTSPFIKQVVDAAAGLPKDQTKVVTIDYANAMTAIKSSPKLYRYTGSLTTPPCTEGVNWLVASGDVFGITVEDFQKLADLLKHSARPTQPLADYMDENWATKRKSSYNP